MRLEAFKNLLELSLDMDPNVICKIGLEVFQISIVL